MTTERIPWLQRPENEILVSQLRAKVAREDSDVLIFLGAGLSYGVMPGREVFELRGDDDDRRFPSWQGLRRLMYWRLQALPDLAPHLHALRAFFKEQDSLDCAELFREKMGRAN